MTGSVEQRVLDLEEALGFTSVVAGLALVVLEESGLDGFQVVIGGETLPPIGELIRKAAAIALPLNQATEARQARASRTALALVDPT